MTFGMRIVATMFAGSALAIAASGVAAAVGLERLPVHGRVLDVSPGHAIVRLDAVTAMMPATTAAVRTSGEKLAPGESFDAILERGAGPDRLTDPVASERFAAGLPNRLITHVLAVGDTLPNATLLDQRDVPLELDRFRGKTLLVSFAFTRCPDKTICPAISTKFAYIQHRIDPAKFHILEITLDPNFDSPTILARYGKELGADPARWSLLDGRAYDIDNLMDGFGISSVADGADNFIHDDRLVLVDPKGTIRDVIPTAGWSADDVIAQANDVAGLSSNPLRRFELASVAGIIALCGGSPTTGTVVLDSAVFLLGVAILGSAIVWFGRRIFAGE